MGGEDQATVTDWGWTPGDPSLSVYAKVTTPTSGWEVSIRLMSDGIIPDPAVAHVLVHAIAPGPEADTTGGPVETELSVSVPDAPELSSVAMHLSGATFPNGTVDFIILVGD